MPIPLIHEDDDDMSAVAAFNLLDVVEECHFCKKGTRFAHTTTNHHVCVKCSFEHEESALPEGPKVKHPRKVKALTREQLELREKDDDLCIEHRRLEIELSRVMSKRRQIQGELKEHGIVSKRPWDSSRTIQAERPRKKA